MSHTRYGVSPWIDQVSRRQRPDRPRARGTLAAPVVIVGGGLTGCLTAYAFAAAGVKVVLLEAERIAHGGSGRGPGILKGEAGPSYRDLEARHGRKAARSMFESIRRGVLDFAATARRLGLRAGVETVDALRVVPPLRSDEKALARDATLRREAGLDAVWLRAATAARESTVEGARAAVRFHEWGVADPYRAAIGALRAAEARGAAAFERSPVRRIKVRRKDLELTAEGATITADTVVICTGEPTDLHRPLKRHVRLDDRYAALTDRLPAAARRAIAGGIVITDTDAPPHVVRWTGEGQLLVAGGDQPRQPARSRDKVIVQRTGQLMYELSRLFPAMSGVQPLYGWDQPLATTGDGVMYAGPHRNYPRHLFAWATGHDPAQAFLASRILLRHYLGQAGREDGYFGFTRG